MNGASGAGLAALADSGASLTSPAARCTATTCDVANSSRASAATCSDSAWIQPPDAATRRTTGPNAATVGVQRSGAVTNVQSWTVTTVCGPGGAM